MNENQGKRSDQIKYSEKVIFFSFIAMLIALIIQIIIDITNNK
jgi:cell division protein FtsL